MKRQPFPLQWPDGVRRTKQGSRQRSRFGHRGQVSFAQARREMLLELDRIGAANIVLTSDLPVRHDGLPYANGGAEDPGVAVWCVVPNGGKFVERVFACDAWLTHAENMTAIARSVEALRGLDRWGMAEASERAFAGFAALPPGDGSEHVAPPTPKKREWHEVLGVTDLFKSGMLADGDLLAIVKTRHREAIRLHHPDAGGDVAIAAELNAALAEAEKELGG